MTMSDDGILKGLTRLYKKTSPLSIDDTSKWVIFSDLHMGDGSPMDDFLMNAPLFSYLLETHYIPQDYMLILNGDIEELHRFPYSAIYEKWKKIYDIWGKLNAKGKIYKLIGNHDYLLWKRKINPEVVPLRESLTLNYKGNHLFIFHGHQGASFSAAGHLFARFVLRYLAMPLGIKSYSLAYDYKKKFKLEQLVYDFARSHKLLALIGHTHRPLFESLSKLDSLKFKLESMCREYPQLLSHEQALLASKIKKVKNKMEKLISKRKGPRGSLYASEPLIPCIFNSGCVIGKSGLTALEISNGMIRLVQWFDKRRFQKEMDEDVHVEQLGETDYYRVVLKEEPLNYIFTRVQLLS